MTAINPALLVLLDIQNEHIDLDRIFNPQLFCRFNNKAQCLAHVAARQSNIRWLHFFIPETEHVVIDTDFVVFNTIYYIYCMNDTSMNEILPKYNCPMFVKIFHVKSLSRYLRQAAIAYLIEQAERTKHEPDERDIALQLAAELTDALADDLRKHMNDKTGVISEDH